MRRDFDLVLFGATSFVGYFTIRELLLSFEQNSSEYAHIRWAIAGRDGPKMANVVKRLLAEEHNLKPESKSALQSAPMIVADVEDQASLEAMTARTTLLVNTVGPYLLYGRPVVEACLATGTHYIDLSAELQFNERLQVDAHARAQSADLCLVTCAGWASVPVDLGVAYLKENFNQNGGDQLSSVEVHVDIKPCPKTGYRLHTGTWDSMLTVYVRYRELAAIRAELFTDDILPASVPYSGPKLKQNLIRFPRLFKSGSSSTTSPKHHLEILFPGPDVSVVQRTQHYNFRHFSSEPPVQVTQYIRVRAVANQLIGFPLILALFWHRPGRWLLRRNVHLFTGGFISRTGPTRAQIEGTTCSFVLVGRGFSSEKKEEDFSKDSETKKKKKIKADKKMSLKIECSEPAYLATSTFLVQCALSLLVDFEAVPT